MLPDIVTNIIGLTKGHFLSKKEEHLKKKVVLLKTNMYESFHLKSSNRQSRPILDFSATL